MASDYIPAKLQRIAESAGYRVDHKPTVRRRGWPTPSSRPYHLLFSDGTHLAAFATLDGLEHNLRARAGC